MPKQYLRKALEVLSQRNRGPTLCDVVAQRLTAAGAGEVRAVDSHLDFGWLAYQMRGVYLPVGESPQKRADMRRAAMLLVRVLSHGHAPAGLQPASWDDGHLRAVFTHYASSVPGLAGTGYYLRGSFWAFSSHDERVWLENAWREAGEMVAAGLDVARSHAQADVNIVIRWFGEHQQVSVLRRLRLIQDGMIGRLLGIGYQGTGVDPAADYREIGEQALATKVERNDDEYGWAAPTIANVSALGVCVKFFRQNLTATSPRSWHDTASAHTEVSRGGALMHEISHRHAATDDRTMPDGNAAYGPRRCHALARAAPQDAVLNADNYRLFCEDAFYWRS